MKVNCPCPHCVLNLIDPQLKVSGDIDTGQSVRFGSYFRSSDSKWIQRFRCCQCKKTFSRATNSSCFGQKKRRLNPNIRKLLISGVSQRQAARILNVNPKTIVRKFEFLAREARKSQTRYRESFRRFPVGRVQFDDLETSEHTKCKPLSVTLAVASESRKILAFQVSQMPPKGSLAKFSYKKYGPRKDERPEGWNALMFDLKNIVKQDALFLSDQNPHYPRFVKKYFPAAKHETVKGKRGCIAGQGELKKVVFDPLFSLNHTCAMLRAHLNRLFRRTWCTTKKREALANHIALYVDYHNRFRTAP